MDMDFPESEIKRCLSCPKPRCVMGCPLGNDIRDFIFASKNNDLDEAARILYAKNPFPEWTSRLCDHDRQCRGNCVLNARKAPINVPEIEKAIAANRPFPFASKPNNGKSIAIVGSGPAGLSAAAFLALEGCAVDIYEKEDSLGGALLTGIPGYRFDHALLRPAQDRLEKLGVVFHFGFEIGESHPLSSIQDTHDRVLLCFGAQKENFAGLGKAPGIVGGLSLLRELNVQSKGNEYASKYHKALVWGGGNVAMDCARSLIRLLPEVTVVYRRSRKEMPANDSEIEEAIHEGVRFAFLTNVKEADVQEDGFHGIQAVKMELGEPDESGRASFHEIPGSEFPIEADLLVLAIGQKADFSPFGLDRAEQREIAPNLFVAGDAFTGPKNVAAAIADGRSAAKEILESL